MQLIAKNNCDFPTMRQSGCLYVDKTGWLAKMARTRFTVVLAAGFLAFAAPGAITVDFNRIVGPVKPEHGVGQPPMSGMPNSAPMMFYLQHAGVPFSRLI